MISTSFLSSWTVRVVIWILFSVLPIGPFTIPLLQGSLSDSPRSYLLWIPVLSFCWAVWNMHKGRARLVESKLTGVNPWWGLGIAVLAGLILAVGKNLWPEVMIGDNVALLLWPLWAFGMAWMLFGAHVIAVISKPLIYLFLVWPSIYEAIIHRINPYLLQHTVSLIALISDHLGWIHSDPVPHVFDVATGAGIVRVNITNACSGSDSVLALLVLFPVMLVLFDLRPVQKIILIMAGCLLVFLANVLRIGLIILALHQFGYWFAFDVLHPILGPILFFLVAGLLLLYASRTMLSVAKLPNVDTYCVETSRVVITSIVTVVLTIVLVPLYEWPSGSILKPLHVPQYNVAEFFPHVSGYSYRIVNDHNRGRNKDYSAIYRSATQTMEVHLTLINHQGLRKRGLVLHSTFDQVLQKRTLYLKKGIKGIQYLVIQSRPAQSQPPLIYVYTVCSYYVVYQYHRGIVRVVVDAPLGKGLSESRANEVNMSAFHQFDSFQTALLNKLLERR